LPSPLKACLSWSFFRILFCAALRQKRGVRFALFEKRDKKKQAAAFGVASPTALVNACSIYIIARLFSACQQKRE
jgi:hypothetical protein